MHRITLLLMITALFAAGGPAWGAQFAIAVSANAGGLVSPREGKNLVEEGANLDVALSPRAGYHISRVVVDGAEVPVTDRTYFSYRFTDVRKNMRISARFARNPAITVNYTAGGSIDSGKGKVFVPYSTSRTFLIAPEAGHHVERIVVDGNAVGETGTYTFPNVTGPHSLKAVFATNRYPVTLSAEAGGKITPVVTSALHGKTKKFTITPANGMRIESVTVNGTPLDNLPVSGSCTVTRTITGDLSIVAHFAEAATSATVFRKLPYLVYAGSDTSMKVLWQTNKATSSTLSWGTDISYTSGSVTSTEATSDHLFAQTLTGLTPGTKYFYRVSLPNAQATGSFLAPPQSSSTPVKIFALGDTRSNPAVHDALAAQMIGEYTRDPELQSIALYSGDLVYDGTSDSTWQSQLFSPQFVNLATMGAEVPRVVTIGNHEGNGDLFRKFFPYPFVAGRYWSFDYGPLHVVVGDQYDGGGSMSAQQLAWMRDDLAASSRPWKIIMVHEPGWSAGGHGNNSQVQEKIQPLAKEHGALVITGHNHYYARAVVDGINHVTTGGGGAPLNSPEQGRPNIVISDRSHHFCTISADNDTLTFTAIRADGTIIETFDMKK